MVIRCEDASMLVRLRNAGEWIDGSGEGEDIEISEGTMKRDEPLLQRGWDGYMNGSFNEFH